MTEFDPFQASASAVSKFELCPRKWGWHKLDGLESPPGPGAEFGTTTHGHVERWLTTRVPPIENTREQRVAQAIIQHLPPPQLVDPNNVEMGLSILLGGVFFIGYIDLFMPEHPVSKLPRVYDHKTTSDFGWALAPETMPDDVQATLYAVWAMTKMKAPVVEVQWTYGLTKGAPKSLPVFRQFTKDDIKDRINKTIETARTMREITTMGVTAIDLPYNAEGCEAFGGCPFKDKCNLSAQERIESIMSQANAQGSLLDQLRAKRNASKGAAPAPGTGTQPVNPPSAGTQPVNPPSGNGAAAATVSPLERLRQKKAEQEAATPPAAETPTPEPPTTVLAQVQPRATPGPGRPKKARVESTVEDAVLDKPEHLWVIFAAAALVGGKNVEQAQSDASDLVLVHAELFPKEK